MKIKIVGYAEALGKWYPLMNGEGLIVIVEEDQEPFDYINWIMQQSGIEHYLVTYIPLEK